MRANTKAREVEERRVADRRKAALVLMLRHLSDHGYLNSIDAIQAESGVSLKQLDVADNISLLGVLQEFEEFYEVKFGRKPKFVRKFPDVEAEGGSLSSTKGRGALVTMNGASSATRTKSSALASKRTQLKKTSPDDIDLGLDGTPIITELCTKQSGKSSSGNLDEHGMMPMLKPLPDFGGNQEMRELASIITREIYTESPNVTWNSIAGLDSAKRLVKEAVIMPHRYPQLFKGILRPWKGILLYGPPGTGKTMIAKAIATECKTTFFNISASSVMSKWRGDSEKLIRVLFELARYHAPSTIFMDELDSLIGQRGGDASGIGEHEASRRLKTELLIQMDGLSSLATQSQDQDDSSNRILFLGATNLPWELDSAMLRRLEKRIEIPLPSAEGRKKIFETLLNNENGGPAVEANIDFAEMAVVTDGFSGADVALVCKEAAMRPLRRLMDQLERISDHIPEDDKVVSVDPVTFDDIRCAYQTTTPTGTVHSAKYKEFAQRYGQVGVA